MENFNNPENKQAMPEEEKSTEVSLDQAESIQEKKEEEIEAQKEIDEVRAEIENMDKNTPEETTGDKAEEQGQVDKALEGQKEQKEEGLWAKIKGMFGAK